jgi:hypothetical protein
MGTDRRPWCLQRRSLTVFFLRDVLGQFASDYRSIDERSPLWFSFVCSVHHLPAALHDSSDKTRTNPKVVLTMHIPMVLYRVADILVNINFYLGIYLSPSLDIPIRNGDAR